MTTLSELIKVLPAGLTLATVKDNVNGKQITYYVDGIDTGKVDKRKNPIIVPANENAAKVHSKKFVNLTVPNEVLIALASKGITKESHASRRWLIADLDDAQLNAIAIAKGKMVFLRLDLKMKELAKKVRNGCINKGVTMLDEDVDTFTAKVEAFKSELDAMLVAGVEQAEAIDEDY